MKITRAICAAFCIGLFSSPALASKCSVKEYNAIGVASGMQAQVPFEPAIADTPLDFTAGHVELTFNVATSLYRIICDAQAAWVVGTAPVATTSNSFLAADISEAFGITPNTNLKLSVVARP